MRYVWPAWLVFSSLATLFALLRPGRTATQLSSVIGLLGAATFIGWLTNGGFFLCLALGITVAYPSLCLIFLALRPAPRPPLPPGSAQVFARQAVVPAVVWGSAIGLAFGVGGRLSGSDFVVWRASLGGGLVWLGVSAWLWQLRGKPIVGP